MRKTSQKFCKSSWLCKIALVVALLTMQAMYGMAGALSAKPVSGTVVSSTDGEPLIGATVQVEGVQGVGTVTDFDGKFTIEAKDGQTLVVSYIGYITKKVKVAGGG